MVALSSWQIKSFGFRQSNMSFQGLQCLLECIVFASLANIPVENYYYILCFAYCFSHRNNRHRMRTQSRIMSPLFPKHALRNLRFCGENILLRKQRSTHSMSINSMVSAQLSMKLLMSVNSEIVFLSLESYVMWIEEYSLCKILSQSFYRIPDNEETLQTNGESRIVGGEPHPPPTATFGDNLGMHGTQEGDLTFIM